MKDSGKEKERRGGQREGEQWNEGKEKQWEKEDEMEAKNKVWGVRNWAKAAKKESAEEKDERWSVEEKSGEKIVVTGMKNK